MTLPTKRSIAVHLAVLVCLCGLVQVVVVSRAAVTGIDAVRFVRIARQIDAVGFLQTTRGEGEQPLFPLALSATHGLLRAVAGETPSLWATSAQTTAAVALILAVVPVYLIARRMVGPTGGLIAGVFFCVLPEVARLGGDGISDSTHLLFFALAFWTVLEFFRAGNVLFLVGSGVCVGLALLTRVESIVLLPAVLATMLVCQFRVETRRAWSKLLGASGALSLGLAIVLGPYLVAVGPGGPRESAVGNAALRVLGRWHPPSTDEPVADASAWRAFDGHRVVFGVKEPGESVRRRGYLAAAWQFADELADATGYVVGALSLLGFVYLWRLGGLRPREPETLAGLFSLLFAATVISFTAAEGYLNARHLLPLVVVSIPLAAVATVAARKKGDILLFSRLGIRPSNLYRQNRKKGRKKRDIPLFGWSGNLRNILSRQKVECPLFFLLFFLAVVVCLVTTLRPLHAGRVAHRLAGGWLATADEPGVVLDTKGWTDLYSTRTTFQYDQARETFADRRLAYVVVQHGDLQSGSDRARTLRFLLGAAAEPAASFAGRDGRHDSRSAVTVYRWHAERFRRLISAQTQPAARLTNSPSEISAPVEQTYNSHTATPLAAKGDT